ncbi:TrkH family potassium uptake protein [Aerococcus sanguinicola]|uniref:TrkH family potassium uptake protein n=1 Tax=unclassified Aerococcus TaxID=2618060 RepID=UPI0009F38462|nr:MULTISPECIES: potassium transporter TrkG [unclassified Aerococcus]MDK6233349.1 potassium transporter TrkG [Aerococcus sp. UMB10185]MDK6855178.1 potassium transporter TrkG [Aerococcus sp. UMB7533]
MLQFLNKLGSSQKIALSFLVVILIGSVLLSLPICQTASSQATYWDNLFISVSAVCVTGLWTQSIHDSYNLLGQIVMMGLIQTGGLGLMTLISIVYHRLGQRLDIRNQMATGDALNHSELDDLSAFLSRILKYSLVIEGIGALLLTSFFVPRFGLARGLFHSLFTAVSAFCNAGFDLMGNNSLLDYQTAPVLNLTIMALIILGGIGFSVWFDVSQQLRRFYHEKKRIKFSYFIKHLRPHTKLVLGLTVLLIVLGTLLFLLVEWSNPNTLGPLNPLDKLLVSSFQTVTMRTAGFASVDYSQSHPVSLLIFVLTMFIGGGAGGTAGGLKVTTFALTLMLALKEIRQSKYVSFDHHTIPDSTVRKAFAIALMYAALLFTGSALLLTFDPQVPYLHLLFEAISALATVGVSCNLTPSLSMASQGTLMFLMYIGRIGPMTLFLVLLGRKRQKIDIQYAKTNIIIG